MHTQNHPSSSGNQKNVHPSLAWLPCPSNRAPAHPGQGPAPLLCAHAFATRHAGKQTNCSRRGCDAACRLAEQPAGLQSNAGQAGKKGRGALPGWASVAPSS